ncbi:MAG: thioredoxin [Flavobacteriales bacterium]
MNSTPSTSGFQQLIHGEKPVVVDFFAEWCGPCKMMKPILEQFKQRIGDRARVIKIDVDRNPSAANAYGVRSVPTLVIFKNGAVVWRKAGVVSAEQLSAALEPFL